MKLLIVTQKIDKNDDILGFFHEWVAKFAQYYEKVTVIALGVGSSCEIAQSDNFSKRKIISQGDYDLPRNVKVLSLGKQKNTLSLRGMKRSEMTKQSRQSRQEYIINFYKYIWSERKNYDDVFVHMNPEYVVLGGLFWRLMGKKVGLWYTHKAVNFKLFLASKLANIIFTASSESFGLKSKKLKIMGHGIDTDKFKFQQPKKTNEIFTVICVGRLSSIKNQKLLIEAVDWLVHKEKFKNFRVDLIGSASSQDREYEKELRQLVQKRELTDFVNFVGSVSHKNILDIYSNADLSVNLCPTGGMDKVVLESMACGIPVIVLNRTFEDIVSDRFILENDNPKILAQKIITLSKENSQQEDLRNKVIRHHSLENLIRNIVNIYRA